LAAATLGGCSASEIVQNWGSPAVVADPSQPDYRRIIGDNIQVLFSDKRLLDDMEISGIRPVDHLRGPAWIVCLKLDAHRTAQQYAVFIQGDKIIDSRLGIVIDHCHKEAYTHFEPPTVKKTDTNQTTAGARK
jgi:hypothetical protein